MRGTYLGHVADEPVERDVPATCAIEPKDAGRGRGQRTVAYNCRNVVICVMLAGSIPVKRFSPSNLPGHHQRQAAAAGIDRARERTDWRWMASRKQRPGTGPLAHSLRRFCCTTRCRCRGRAQRRHWSAGGRAQGPCFDYYATLAARPDMVHVVVELAVCCLGEHASARGLPWGAHGHGVRLLLRVNAGAHR